MSEVNARLVLVCRVCRKVDAPIVYREEQPDLAICPDCCDGAEHADGETGHVWEYDEWERGSVCTHCGICRRDTEYRDEEWSHGQLDGW